MKNIQQEAINGNINQYSSLEFCKEKLLYREDIESLGFTLHYKPHNKKFYFKNQDEKIGITLRKDFYNDGFCNAHIYELREPISTLFSGKIKNKTELIKLLKQLDINYGI